MGLLDIKMTKKTNQQIYWVKDKKQANRFATFFVKNVDSKYISHGEIQDGRAKDFETWRSDLLPIMTKEFSQACDPKDPNVQLFVIKQGPKLCGLGLLNIYPERQIPFAVLQDLVIDRIHRSQGLGEIALTWLKKELRSQGLKQLFLESGIQNISAHRFFEKQGFSIVSKIMVSDLGPK